MNIHRRMHGAGLAALAALIVLAAQGTWAQEDLRSVVPTEVPGVVNASKTSDGKVYFGGQPTQESVDALKKNGVKVVINLRRAEEMEKVDFDEKNAVEAAGMKYVNVPMESTGLPTAESLKPLLVTLGDAKDAPVFLHCGSSNRVGGVWALYEGTQGGKSADDAIAEGKKAGLKTPALEKDVRTRLENASEDSGK